MESLMHYTHTHARTYKHTKKKKKKYWKISGKQSPVQGCESQKNSLQLLKILSCIATGQEGKKKDWELVPELNYKCSSAPENIEFSILTCLLC